ncbi:MAG: LacI family DNA-binding transcriptional regulator [Patescibacteria group bacterium]|nr:LacI family transcriptional regulator [Planctomycetaceae bacterium]
MAVTLKEVARMAGVSPSTASHAIRGIHPGKRALSALTIKRVREVAEQLGYRPNLLAAGLANNKTFTIGVMVANLRGNFHERILKGITETIYPEYTPLLSVHNNQPDREHREIEFFIGKHVDGIIAAYSGYQQNIHIYREIQKYKIPLVLVDRGIEDFQCHLVKSDYYNSAYIAVETLNKLGHRNIVFALSGRQSENTNMLIDGFKAAVSEKNLNESAEIYNADMPASSEDDSKNLAENIVDYIKSKKPQTTALLAERDWLAYEILAVCQERGIKIPQEISLMGIEDSDPSALRCVGLSSVRIELHEVGRRAADLLVKIINSAEVGNEPLAVKPTVMLRRTTSPLK